MKAYKVTQHKVVAVHKEFYVHADTEIEARQMVKKESENEPITEWDWDSIKIVATEVDEIGDVDDLEPQ